MALYRVEIHTQNPGEILDTSDAALTSPQCDLTKSTQERDDDMGF